MKQSNYGPCGLYCGACGAEDCDGCLSDNVDDWVKGCKFRQCSKDQNIDFCCFCNDYPCTELQEFMNDKWPHHWTMEPNLEYIKKNGVEKWLLAQQKEWACNNCGAEINWYQKICNCGQPLEAWELPT
jgi:hypothetical protein